MSEIMQPPKSEALKALYWRSEILQVMFWLRGERFGLGDTRQEADPLLLERFLGVDASIGVKYLDRLVEEGFIERVGDNRFILSETGAREGGLEFAMSFEEMNRPTHGECSADCWCHNDPDEAAACAADRAAHQH